MDGRFNTIAGWVLGAGIVFLGATLVSKEIFKAERPDPMGYPIAGVEEETKGGAAAEQPIAFYPADRRRRPRRGDLPPLRQLPHDRPGRGQRHRPQSLGDDGQRRRPPRRLFLF